LVGLGLPTCKAGTLLLETPPPQSILLWLFWRWGGVSWTICLDWPHTMILLISLPAPGKFHFLENDETTNNMTWFLIGNDEAEAKCKLFCSRAGLNNLMINVGSQFRSPKAPQNVFVFSPSEGMFKGLNFLKKKKKVKDLISFSLWGHSLCLGWTIP
jgi:hypothetical protein